MKYSILFLLPLMAIIPFLPYYGDYNLVISDSMSELPVKLWAYEQFYHPSKLFGTQITSVGFPEHGALNNPDIFACLYFNSFRPFLGDVITYNSMLYVIMLLNMSAAWMLARQWVGHLEAYLASIVFAWSPLVLSYCIAGAITDVYHIWPYPLGILLFQRSLLSSRYRLAILSGSIFALGFVLCPYNFVIFTPLFLPLLIWLYQTRTQYQQIIPQLVLLLCSCALLTGGYAWQIFNILEANNSQMSTAHLEQTRHSWPFIGLHINQPDRYTATLIDYFSYGKDNVIIREAAARFYRSFSIPWVVLALSMFGIFRGYRLWSITALLFIILSLGPFLPVSLQYYSEYPINIFWLAVQYCWPGTAMILEPFRYALAVFLCLGMAAAIGVQQLKSQWMKVSCLFICAVELLYNSSAPFPLPRSDINVPPFYEQLDQHIEEGAIIELPYHSLGTNRFSRRHFLHQRVHQRSIPNIIPGFVPSLFYENALLHALLELEAPYEIQHGNPAVIPESIVSLKEEGFVAIVITPRLYGDQEKWYQAYSLLVKYLGPPDYEGQQVVFQLYH